MTTDELHNFARAIIENCIEDLEFLSIFELAETYTKDGEISNDDAKKVMRLITLAELDILFPDEKRI